MINQIFGQRGMAALSRRVAHQRRVDAIRTSKTAKCIRYFLKMLAVAFLILSLLTVAGLFDQRGETRTIPAEQTSGDSHRRN